MEIACLKDGNLSARKPQAPMDSINSWIFLLLHASVVHIEI